MRIGIIGAGRMGFTLGKHFVLGGLDVAGYYSRSSESAGAAAEFTRKAVRFPIPERAIPLLKTTQQLQETAAGRK